LQLRRFVLTIVVVFVFLFNFASQIGALATVMGFAAAGIAVALQNVILSLAGYFFLIGKFGIKVGDRVQVSGVSGDVIDIGLVKLSLMELGGDANDRQPTGRVAVFSNAVVFQPSGNFFKQIPGTNFVWNEVTLTLSPECDYRLAEKRLLEAVDEVFARHRESIQRQYVEAQISLNMELDLLKPQSRLQLSAEGLRITLRYPAETRSAVQTADEVARRLLDVIAGEPGLKLVASGTANIQPAPQPLPEPSEAEAGNGSLAATKAAK
jgi:small-conductance mechanosensitive channel